AQNTSSTPRSTSPSKKEPIEEPAPKTVAEPFYQTSGERWALVVGISTYEDGRIPQIPNAAEDARAVRDYLVSTKGGGYKPDHVFLLTDYDATSRKLQKYLGSELRKKVQKEDDLLIYFACHGMAVPTPKAGSEDGLEKYLVPYDTVAEDVVVDGISMTALDTQLDIIECNQIAMVLDTCFSGGARSISEGPATRNTTISSSFLKKMAKQKGTKHRTVITASSASELAQDDPDTGHGIFTTYFLEALDQAEDMDGNGSITLYEVFRYLDRKVRVRSAEIGQRQNPQWVGDPAYPFPVKEVKK
ncbi:MAG: caspase family protein, partial [Planctomycetota bacterium]